MPHYYWKKKPGFFQWYCHVDWEAACKCDSGLQEKLRTVYGDLDDINGKIKNHVENPCCGSRMRPWRYKEDGHVVEIDITDNTTNATETFCFMAARLPDELYDEMKNLGAVMKAHQHLTDDKIRESLPKVYPCALVNRDLLPGVRRFPMDEWIKDGRPKLDAPGLIALARKIAASPTWGTASKDSDMGESLESEEGRAEKRMRTSASSSGSK